jgi:hypothetical protein
MSHNQSLGDRVDELLTRQFLAAQQGLPPNAMFFDSFSNMPDEPVPFIIYLAGTRGGRDACHEMAAAVAPDISIDLYRLNPNGKEHCLVFRRDGEIIAPAIQGSEQSVLNIYTKHGVPATSSYLNVHKPEDISGAIRSLAYVASIQEALPPYKQPEILNAEKPAGRFRRTAEAVCAQIEKIGRGMGLIRERRPTASPSQKPKPGAFRRT